MSGLQSNTSGMRCVLQIGEGHDLDTVMFCSLSYCIMILSIIQKNSGRATVCIFDRR